MEELPDATSSACLPEGFEFIVDAVVEAVDDKLGLEEVKMFLGPKGGGDQETGAAMLVDKLVNRRMMIVVVLG